MTGTMSILFFLFFVFSWLVGRPQRGIKGTGASVVWEEAEISGTAHFGEQKAWKGLIKGEGDTSKAVTSSSLWSNEDKRQWLYS